ncbi:hypothetical protein [Metallosphaera hakonensis]|uniref:Uncharacterized protein n=1 Tax=Metallosphaera hakonensis JCM 8857 = DSM 7519 TaxID=1293036 RepID=A0A2U9IWQ9_9CREN|nr:hypothetical protein [Metallosphaera hakonensis]AWS00403.1 hypothetical protein DFR87_12785 [Metallosphaera hakonensis JCM 8857 = DSM 7519]
MGNSNEVSGIVIPLLNRPSMTRISVVNVKLESNDKESESSLKPVKLLPPLLEQGYEENSLVLKAG